MTTTTDEEFKLVYEMEFMFYGSKIWVRANVDTDEALNCFKTGLLRNQQVHSVKLFSITEDGTEVIFVYNIEAVLKGQQPWSLLYKQIAPGT